MKDPLCVGDFTGANKYGSCIDQTPITRDFCPYLSRLNAQYDRFNIEITYLREICHSVYKRFLSAIDLLDCHPSMNNTKCPGTQT